MTKFVFYISVFFFAFCSNGQQLNRYEMYSDHFDIEGYTKQYQRSFDSAGIIKQKNEYHALTISLYGIMCYDEYIKTGNEHYREQCENQFKYFRDTSKYDYLFGGKGVGLPYEFKFHDLTPPWYSGLTQGIAVSFLLRYADLKKDAFALDLAKKVAYPMFVPVKDGGTLSNTPEGGLWIEEYPNSKRSKQVLNGFINGLVGMKEYLQFFPEDTMAQRIHQEVYTSFKETINAYDNPANWTSYDRNNKSISIYYLRIQLTQLDHLYSLYGDPFLRDQMGIWSRMIIGKKDKEFKFYKYPDYNYGILIDPKNAQEEFDLDFSKDYKASISINENLTLLKRNKKEIAYKNGYSGKRTISIVPHHAIQSMRLDFGSNVKKYAVTFFFEDGSKQTVSTNAYLTFNEFFFDKEFDSVTISKKGLSKKISIQNISFYDYRKYQIPMYATYNVPGIHSLKKGGKYFLTADQSGLEGAKVYYRFASNSANITKTKWVWSQSFPLQNGVVIPDDDGFYEFFISVPVHTEKIILRNVRLNIAE